MTKQEILDGLEGLKDMVNHVGKQTIDSLKAGISMNLLDREEATFSSAPIDDTGLPEVHLPQEEKFVSGGRFAEKTPPEFDTSGQEPERALNAKAYTKEESKKKTVPHGTKKKK